MEEILKNNIFVKYNDFEKISGYKAFLSELSNKEEDGVGGRGHVYFGTSGLNILRGDKRPFKKIDRLVVQNIDGVTIKIIDRATKTEYSIPTKKVKPSIRTLSCSGGIDLSQQTDWVISEYTQELDDIMRSIYGKDMARKYIQRVKAKWKVRVKTGSATVHLPRKFDIGAPGTSYIARYTNMPSFLAHPGWGINGSEEGAKLLALWFNSSLFLFQMLPERTQIRGTYWRLDKKRLARTFIPNITLLTKEQKGELIRIFDEIKDSQFPSVLEQYKTADSRKMRIDEAWFKAFGLNDMDIKAITDLLYPYINKSLSQLLKTMN